MKVMNIALMVLRIAFILVLVLGIIFWVNPALPLENQGLRGIHMLLGIIVVLALWVIGIAQVGIKGSSFALAIVTFIVGLAVAIVGFSQDAMKASAGVGTTELINIIHLLLGLIAIGTGEMVVAHTKRLVKANALAKENAEVKA